MEPAARNLVEVATSLDFGEVDVVLDFVGIVDLGLAIEVFDEALEVFLARVFFGDSGFTLLEFTRSSTYFTTSSRV